MYHFMSFRTINIPSSCFGVPLCRPPLADNRGGSLAQWRGGGRSPLLILLSLPPRYCAKLLVVRMFAKRLPKLPPLL